MSSNKTIIIGGVAGGASCAVRLRRIDEKAEIIMIERGEHISFANCGLPYYIGEIIKDESKLLVETPEKMHASFNIDIRTKSEALKINREAKTIEIHDLSNNNIYTESYDKLVLSPGATPVRPPIPGINLSKIFTLRNIPDTEAIKNYIDENHPSHALVVGGGFIGLEMAENLVQRGIKVTVNELANQVMRPLDYEMAAYVHQHLKSQDIELYLNDGVKSFEEEDKDIIIVTLNSGTKIRTNMVIFGIGVKPENKLAKEANLTLGERGGIKVNKRLETNDPNIYAIGDAIEVEDFINKNSTLIPLAGPANKQGRIVANNINGNIEEFHGTQGTSIAKIFDLTIATTGNNEKTLNRYGISYLKSYTQNSSHAGYYPGAIPMSMKIIFAPDNGKILGAQIVGYDGVDKRIDVLATAIRANMTVYDLEQLELAYAPPYSSAKDPVNIAGFVASNILKGDMEVVFWDDIAKIDPKKTILLDIRTELEMKLGKLPNSLHIPLDNLRDRINEIPVGKELIVYCQAGQRGYYAARILMQHGFKVKNLSGGYKAYKIVTEKQSNEGVFADLGIKTDDVIHAVPTKEYIDDDIQAAIEVDACGLACPGPIMKVAEGMDSLNAGEILKITATDPGFFSDVKVWAKSTNNTIMNIVKENREIVALIKKDIPEKTPMANIGSLPTGKNLIVFSGDLDKAIAAFIIANGSVAMGSEVSIFFTFWGLNILRKPKKVKVKKNFIERMFGKMMPRGTEKLEISQMKMLGMGTKMIKGIMKKHNISSLHDLIQSALKNGVKLVACQMTMDLMGIKEEELIEGVSLGGVATMLGAAEEANMSLFI
ncbi:CoA-disulfide reductase [Promethearchaeum syntrophicum]|uniref:CoA-disulfide reductase n=1 Tax=Promethearchaeum syntrophicum TaxID=2594042 RepID=A0A5B9DDT2_9ARCH|nr:CoA-disulfide reductase [Candidatus Prometheoarchaeum syntrophicum]QEE16950.1 Coenzyme A disulfide reductase [Candidatus Prometheoarchaeum syntrophicum]